jgi:folate-dependent phosphoribosylglycinamide formyltransferase PurN
MTESYVASGFSRTSSSPSVVLICHESDPLDTEGLAAWLASTMDLRGLVVIRNSRQRLWRTARREIRRVGWLGFADVVAFRLYAAAALARQHEEWKTGELARLRVRYPADLTRVPRIAVDDPNSAEARDFLTAQQPDVVIARCKVILKPAIFSIARAGTFALHPGICPEYRNAHGCFWALANRDLERVGMTLLRIDAGVDTGPVYLQATCAFDETRESHIVIQYRVVLENLDAIGRRLIAAARGQHTPQSTAGRRSATWGQPRLSTYLRWKWDARRSRRDATGVVTVP